MEYEAYYDETTNQNIVRLAVFYRSNEEDGFGISIPPEYFPAVMEVLSKTRQMWEGVKGTEDGEELYQHFINILKDQMIKEDKNNDGNMFNLDDVLRIFAAMYILEREDYVVSDEYNGLQVLSATASDRVLH